MCVAGRVRSKLSLSAAQKSHFATRADGFMAGPVPQQNDHDDSSNNDSLCFLICHLNDSLVNFRQLNFLFKSKKFLSEYINGNE